MEPARWNCRFFVDFFLFLNWKTPLRNVSNQRIDQLSTGIIHISIIVHSIVRSHILLVVIVVRVVGSRCGAVILDCLPVSKLNILLEHREK